MDDDVVAVVLVGLDPKWAVERMCVCVCIAHYLHLKIPSKKLKIIVITYSTERTSSAWAAEDSL